MQPQAILLLQGGAATYDVALTVSASSGFTITNILDAVAALTATETVAFTPGDAIQLSVALALTASPALTLTASLGIYTSLLTSAGATLTESALVNWLGVLTASGSEEGLKAAREERPDLLLLDVNLGRGAADGYSFCARLKQDDQTFDTPVIFLSGQTSAGDMLRGFYAGAHEYLTKPVDREALLNRLRKLLGP